MNDVTWEYCCKKVVRKYEKEGFESVSYRSIENWDISFRVKSKFPHPNIKVELNRKYSHWLLDAFPEAKPLINTWASKN